MDAAPSSRGAAFARDGLNSVAMLFRHFVMTGLGSAVACAALLTTPSSGPGRFRPGR
jgi:hypothetical protein